MPALGMAQETGILLQWLKREGEPVKAGEPLMEIETDKATAELEAPGSGVLSHVTAAPGDEVPVGQTVAWILAPGEAPPEDEHEASARNDEPPSPQKVNPVSASSTAPETPQRTDGEVSASPVAARIAATHDVNLRQVPASGRRVTKADVLAYLDAQQTGNIAVPRLLPASPKARRLAQEQELNLAMIDGSGPQGAVLAADVQTAVEARAQQPPAPALAVSHSWRTMVQRLSQSWQATPHFYLTREVDAARLTAWRAVAQQQNEERITYTDLLVRLVAVALRRHERVNASWQGDTIVANDDINIGLAVAVADGLVAPVIHNADRLTLAQLAQRREEVVGRAKAGKLRLADLQGGTFTVSNLGMYGVDAFSAIVNPPQAAILAVGRIAERVVPLHGQPAIRPMMVLTVSCDHRVVDGARGAQFLDTLAALVEEPLGLIR
jgi:pyruvate dehydrogenase E2 component (dihydrolipoamide acetyltransferase)